MKTLAVLLALAVSNGQAVSYDCQAEKQLILMSDNGEWSYNAGDVEKSQRDTFRWKFLVSQGDGDTLIVSHDPGILDAIGLGGTYPVTAIAPGQFAFSTTKESNCLFTEFSCGALVEISDIDDRKASFSLVPMGSLIKEDESREIFQMVMLGTCKKIEVSE